MRINENGRSMIEMLGVLAIIGVLSVGGIAGYSKAMAKFRANKTIDQVQHIVTNIRILFGSQKTYEDLGTGDANTATLLYKANLLPDDMFYGLSGNVENVTFGNIQNPYSGDVVIKASKMFADKDNKAFTVIYKGVPQSACIDLASQDWNASAGSGLIVFGISDDKNDIVDGVVIPCAEDKKTSGKVCLQDMPMGVGVATTFCKPGSANSLQFKFH